MNVEMGWRMSEGMNEEMDNNDGHFFHSISPSVSSTPLQLPASFHMNDSVAFAPYILAAHTTSVRLSNKNHLIILDLIMVGQSSARFDSQARLSRQAPNLSRASIGSQWLDDRLGSLQSCSRSRFLIEHHVLVDYF